MRLLGFEVSVSKAVPAGQLLPAPRYGGGWWGSFVGAVRESFPGAWQKNVTVDTCENILKFSAVYACVSLIAGDISKLRIKLIEDAGDDIWDETTNPAYTPVLRKPNRYQTRIQFLSQWITCKLLHGNAYILKERDARNVVVALYVLDPSRVTPLVAEDGAVYYRLATDYLAGLDGDTDLIVPAAEIIHDRMLTLWHPLIGVSPIYACGSSATQGLRIQGNSAKFFENMSRPSGILTAPGAISDELAARLKAHWETNYVGGSIGKVAVLGDGLKYEAMTIPASDAQLIEQLRWTVEDVARCFHVPLHKLGMGAPTLNNINALNQDYYTQTLQSLIESLELLLDEALALPADIGVELDLDGLLRMDPDSLADFNEKGVRAGILKPNEARFRLNLPPVPGGDTPYLQQQNYSLEALNKRDDSADPFGAAKLAPAPANPPPAGEPNAPTPPAKSADADVLRLMLKVQALCNAEAEHV